MVELETFEEFELPEGEVWVGDAVEVFGKTEWQDILEITSSMLSYKGFTGCFNGSADFYLIDTLDEDPVISIIDYYKAPESEHNKHHVDDVDVSSGYILVLGKEDLERLLNGVDVDTLGTGIMLELEKDTDVKVTIKGVSLGEQILIVR